MENPGAQSGATAYTYYQWSERVC